MKKLLSFLIPIGIMLIIFYIAAALMCATIYLSEMNVLIRHCVFWGWLGVSTIFSGGKALYYIANDN